MKRWELTDMELICALRILGLRMLPGLADPLDELPAEIAQRLKSEAEERLTASKLLSLNFDGELQLDKDLAAELKEAAETGDWYVYLRKTKSGHRQFLAANHIFLKITEQGDALLYEAEDARSEAEDFLETPEYEEMLTSGAVRINTELLRNAEAEAIIEAGCPVEVLQFLAEASGGEGEEWQLTIYAEGFEPVSRTYITMGSHIMQTEMEYDLEGEWLVLTPALHDDLLPMESNIYNTEDFEPEEES